MSRCSLLFSDAGEPGGRIQDDLPAHLRIHGAVERVEDRDLPEVAFPISVTVPLSSLKITATLAFVGAIVGEWMTGSGFNPVGQLLARVGVNSILGFDTNPANAGGIGNLLNLFYYQLDKPGLFASVVVVSILSIAFFGAMVLLERVMVPWQQQR